MIIYLIGCAVVFCLVCITEILVNPIRDIENRDIFNIFMFAAASWAGLFVIILCHCTTALMAISESDFWYKKPFAKNDGGR